MIPGAEYIYQCPNCNNLLKRGSLISGNTFGATLFSDGKQIAPMLPDFPNLTKCKKCNAIFKISELKEVGTYNMWERDGLQKKQKNIMIRVFLPFWLSFSLSFVLISVIIDTALCRFFANNIFLSIMIFAVITIMIFLLLSRKEIRKYKMKNKAKKADSVEFLDVADLFRALKIYPQDELYIRQCIWWKENDYARRFLKYNEKQDLSDIVRYDEENCNALLKLLDKNEYGQKIMMAELYRNLGQFDICMELIETLPLNCHWLKWQFKEECVKKNRFVIQLKQ